MYGSLFVVQLNRIVTNRLMQMNKVGRITVKVQRQSSHKRSHDWCWLVMIQNLSLKTTWLWVPLLSANCSSTKKNQKFRNHKILCFGRKLMFSAVFRNWHVLFLRYHAYQPHLYHVRDWSASDYIVSNIFNSWQCEEVSLLKRLVEIYGLMNELDNNSNFSFSWLNKILIKSNYLISGFDCHFDIILIVF